MPITDMQLGDIIGLDMVRRLSKDGLHVLDIYMTGSIDTDLEKQARALCCAAYLRKPIRRDLLLDAIAALACEDADE